jgi:glutathione synthase
MRLKVAFQMDPIASINIDADSTFVLALEAQKRGHEVFYYTPADMAYLEGRVVARVCPLEVRRERGAHYTLGAVEETELAAMDVILLRQDPPFDMQYITTTHLLDQVHPRTLVVNDPSHVRNAPEKLFVTRFPQLMPATLVTSDRSRIRAFRQKHEDIVIKPLFGNGGLGVFHVRPEDENFNALLEMFQALYPRDPLMVQTYVPAVREGDKRIILVDGEAVGAINRVPQKGESRSNMHVGGQAVRSTLTPREREICDTIGPELKDRGLLFVGIDVIGGLLTEINVTSPTGLQEINRFDNVCLEALVWNAIEARYQATR